MQNKKALKQKVDITEDTNSILREFYTVAQLSEKMQVSERSVADAIRAGVLPAVKRFGRWYITHSDVILFLKP